MMKNFAKRNPAKLLKLKVDTQESIASYLLDVAKKGHDVQRFDPLSPNKGSKPSLSDQNGFYEEFDINSIRKLGFAVTEILLEQEEHEVLGIFRSCRELFSSFSSPEGQIESPISYVQKIDFLPRNFFDDIDPANLVSPNGLRIPVQIQSEQEIQNYSAISLVPKLLLAAISSIHNQVPWMDKDMDLNSTVHTMRPDLDKFEVNAGYGGGYIKQHTDGYWNEILSVPLLVVFLGISNPLMEATSFIPVEAIFKIPSKNNSKYDLWEATFRDILPEGMSSEEFVRWVVCEATKPIFTFTMGALGGDAQRSVTDTALLEKYPNSEYYLFRGKSTFFSRDPNGKLVKEFVNRRIADLEKNKLPDEYIEMSLSSGEMYIAFNGSGLLIDNNAGYRLDGFSYPVAGPATIHGRSRLEVLDGRIDRTLLRGNTLIGPHKMYYSPLDEGENLFAELKAGEFGNQELKSLDRDSFFESDGIVSKLLRKQIDFSALKR